MARFDMQCPRKECQLRQEVLAPLGSVPVAYCLSCGSEMQRVFSKETFPPINYGLRSSGYYKTPEDERIAQYQFEHLK